MPSFHQKHTVFKALRPKRYNTKLKLTVQSTSLAEPAFINETIPEQETESDEDGMNVNQRARSDLQNSTNNVESEAATNSGVQISGALENIHPASDEPENILVDHSCNAETIEKLLNDIRGSCYEVQDEEEETENEYDTVGDISDSSDTEFNEFDEQWSDNDKENNCDTDTDQPIYPGHSMTIHVSLLLILLYSITHSISGSQLSDLLTLIGLHCIEIHPGLRSLFHFKQYFASIKSPLIKHYYCVYCLRCVEQKAEVCPNDLCLKPLTTAKSKSYFIEVPIEAQLRNMFSRPNFTQLIQHRFRRTKHKHNNIEDIYDGQIYKKMTNNCGPLSESYPFNISFTLNTDGVSIFKSSNVSIWPVYLMINELPFKVRKQSENMIFCGLWFGDTKPFMATFSRPIHESLKELEENGISIEVNGEVVICKAFLICTTADLPARSVLMNMTQYNGAYSCQKCRERGETLKTSKGGTIHIFSFNKENPFGLPRTTEQCINDAVEAINIRKTKNGIKGPSFLMGLKFYDFVKGAGIDYMHGVLLGITKLLISLWISSPYSKEDFSISAYSDLIDRRLLQIKPPSFVTRVPRAISTHFNYWKASELRSWLFFYSLPILQDLLEESYFLHYASFVEAVYLLCGTSISEECFCKCEQLLTCFVMTFSNLYGERYQTLNLHSLLHLPDCVRNLGPLWAFSCFSFESANGDITKLFHGTQNIDLQILSSVNVIQTLPALISSAPSNYNDVIKKLYPGRLTKQVIHFHVQFLGKGYDKILSDDVSLQLIKLLRNEPPNMKYFSRVLLRGEVYHSKEYTRVSKRNNYTVKYFCPSSKLFRYGYVQFYGCHNSAVDNADSFAFIIPFEDHGSVVRSSPIQNVLGVRVPHICRVKSSSKVSVIELDNLVEICANITLPNDCISYICETPNRVESD